MFRAKSRFDFSHSYAKLFGLKINKNSPHPFPFIVTVLFSSYKATLSRGDPQSISLQNLCLNCSKILKESHPRGRFLIFFFNFFSFPLFRYHILFTTLTLPTILTLFTNTTNFKHTSSSSSSSFKFLFGYQEHLLSSAFSS